MTSNLEGCFINNSESDTSEFKPAEEAGDDTVLPQNTSPALIQEEFSIENTNNTFPAEIAVDETPGQQAVESPQAFSLVSMSDEALTATAFEGLPATPNMAAQSNGGSSCEDTDLASDISPPPEDGLAELDLSGSDGGNDDPPPEGTASGEENDEPSKPDPHNDKGTEDGNETIVLAEELTPDDKQRIEQCYGVTVQDFEFAQSILGDVKLPADIPTDIYDERREVCKRIIAAREEMRDSMRQWAESHDIAVDEAIIRNWEPNDTETDALRAQLQDQRIRLRMVQGIQEFSTDQEAAAMEQGVPLRDYQIEATEGCHDFLTHAEANEYGGKSGIVDMPTGTGKTGPLVDTIAKLKYGETEEEPTKVMILAPKLEICYQIAETEMSKFAPHLKPKVGLVNQFSKDTDAEIIVTTNDSFRLMAQQGTLPHVHAILGDEAHMLIGEQTSEYLKEYAKDKVLIGFTATPAYNEERSVYSDLFEHEIYQMNFRDAVQTGRLAPVRGFVHMAEPQLENIHLPEDPAARKQVIRQARLAARMQHAEGIVKKAVEEGKGVLIRCPAGEDIDYAVRFRDYLDDKTVRDTNTGYGVRWLNVEAVGGSSKRENWEERTEKYREFNEGNVDALTYVKAISMGVNLPRAKVLVNVWPTTSPVEERQNIGRVMRLIVNDDGDPIEAEVHDYYDPDISKRQYTCLDAFQTKQGELLHRQSDDGEAPIPIPRRFRPKVVPELSGVSASLIKEGAVLHNADAVLPSSLEVMSTFEAVYGERVGVVEASSLLGIHVTTMKSILAGLGSTPDSTLTKDDINAILDLYPALKPQPLPAAGYQSAIQVAREAPELVRMLSLLPYARRQGIIPKRFFDPETKKTNFYFSDAETARLHQDIREGKFRVS